MKLLKWRFEDEENKQVCPFLDSGSTDTDQTTCMSCLKGIINQQTSQNR